MTAKMQNEKARVSTTRTRRAKRKARGRRMLLGRTVVSELKIVTFVDFVDVEDTGNESAGQDNKDKDEEKENRKAAS